jgi:undecaprenyl-phosphate galactose phosphotransferase
VNINDTEMYLERKTVNIDMNNGINKIVKRIIDIMASIVGVIILIPLCLIIKIIYLLNNDTSSIFFIQERIGKNGKIFKMIKFRSMIIGADETLEKLLQENEEARKEYELNKKLKNDPRITKIGKFLRKTSLDEFPQFLNILKGEMSLVGPRPYLEREREDMGKAYNIIIKVKPGLTGLWQISGRSDLNFVERINLDVEYYNKNNLYEDIKILIGTVKTVLFRKGAI